MAGILKRLVNFFRGEPKKAPQERRGMYSKIDAAQTDDSNRRHWANADSLSADAAYNESVRATLRNRSRYEAVNSCYLKGDVNSSAGDLIGTGPRLQLTIPGHADGAKIVERNYGDWCDASLLSINLRILEKSDIRCGDAFGIFDTNERLRNPVKFDVRWVEADLCATPLSLVNDLTVTDGIRFDRFGSPVEYFFYKSHPGGLAPSQEFYRVPAENVVHWFSKDRFSQRRGIPEITPALPLYAQLRRYTLAVLTGAEFAAMLAGVMTSTLPPEDPTTIEAVPRFDPIEMIRGALLTLPDGYAATQFRPEQPTVQYPDFKREILGESGRATGKPGNVVLGNSDKSSFSSGRLDHLPYHRGLRIKRNDLQLIGLDRIFSDGWYPEAVLVGQVPVGLPPIEEWRWLWNFDGMDEIDQTKAATADDTRIKNGTATYAEILAEYGQDWQEVFEQLAREKAYAEELGLPWPILSQPKQDVATSSPGQSTGDEPTAPEPASLEQVVLMALEQAEIGEDQATAIMDGLAPTFAEIRNRALRRGRNGVHKRQA